MFVGHYALGLAARRLEPRLSLGILLAAPQVLDLLWPIFVGPRWQGAARSASSVDVALLFPA